MKSKLLTALIFFGSILSLNAQIYTPGGTIQGSSGSNNVGIGTRSPWSILNLSGSSTTWGTSPSITLTDTTGNAGSRNWLMGNVAVDQYGDLNFAVSGAIGGTPTNTKVTFQKSGNVGIGTTSPGAKLDVIGAYGAFGGSVPSTWGFRVTGISSLVNGNRVLYQHIASTYAELSTYKYDDLTTFPLVLQANGGNVGIGTTSPSELLTISNASRGLLRFDKSGTAIGFIGNEDALFTGGSAATMGVYSMGDLKLGAGNSTIPIISLKSGGNVGIGTTTPSNKMQVYDGNAQAQALFNGYAVVDGRVNTDAGAIQIGAHSNYHGAISYTGAGNTIFSFDNSYDNAGAITQFRMRTAGTPVNAFTILGNGNIGIGTSSPQNNLDVNGTIRAKEFKATLDGWSDYVFDKNYKLPSLDEVETYINKNQKLPDIPSDDEVINNGVKLGEMNTLLLKKVEELTLYVIELNKKIIVLESKIGK